MQAEIYEKGTGGQSRLPAEDADQVIDAVAAAGGEFGKRPVPPGILRNPGGQFPHGAAVLRYQIGIRLSLVVWLSAGKCVPVWIITFLKSLRLLYKEAMRLGESYFLIKLDSLNAH